MVESAEDDYNDEDLIENSELLESRRVESVACRPGLQWLDDSCSGQSHKLKHTFPQNSTEVYPMKIHL